MATLSNVLWLLGDDLDAIMDAVEADEGLEDTHEEAIDKVGYFCINSLRNINFGKQTSSS